MRRLGLCRTFVEVGLATLAIAMFLHHRSMQTATVPRIAPAWQQAVVHRVHTNEKVVALTYDDGPHPVFTPEILRILDKYHVKATFFMIGKRMEDHPEVVKEILDDGHAIGNHTYTHPGNLERDTRKQVTRELMECETVIERIIGERTRLFRPPKGLIDGTIFTIAEDEGYQTILWTVSADHHDAPTPQAMADRVLKHVVPGAIILAHDGTVAGRWKDVAATPLIIESLRKKGYRFVTLPELLKLGLPATPPAQPDTEAKP